MGYDLSAVQNPARLRVLQDLRLLDTPAEHGFDQLTALAARLLHAPLALVSLVDAERQFFKSCVGLDDRQSSLEYSFCQHVVATNDALVIEDARFHPWVHDNPAVRDQGIAAYLGIPLHSPQGYVLGSFCVADYVPRQWSAEDIATMTALAEAVMTEIALRDDIRVRELTEQWLLESEERFRRLSEAAFEAIAFSENGIVFDANSACARLFGYEPSELSGLHAVQFAAPESVELVRQMNGSNNELPYEAVCRRKDGSMFLAELRGRRVPYQGRVVRVTIVRDITERKRAEQALRESEARFRLITENMGDLVCLHDAVGHYLYLSPSAERLLGYPVKELLDNDWYAFVHPDDTERVKVEVRTQLEQEARAVATYRVRCHNGRYTWFETVIAPITDQYGRLIGFQSTSREVGERVAAEQGLKAFAAKLERSNRELQDFAFVASHDLQEPLRKVQAFGDRLQTKFGSVLGDEGLDYLLRMQHAAQRMQGMIIDLLQFSRVTTQAQPFVPVDLHVVAHEVLGDLDVCIEQTGARIDLRSLPTIVADPRQMRQLLQNLLENALKFYHPEQAPQIEVWSERVAEGSAAGQWRIMVRDQGIGFDLKYLERIFTVFQRLHGRGEYAGTGVGLAICRKIVERHSGTITATSTLGQGTTFIVTLPIPQQEA